MKLSQFAKLVGLNENSVRYWVEKGRIVPDKTGPKKHNNYTEKNIEEALIIKDERYNPKTWKGL